ncbi:MAG: hypothetical protein M3P95_07060 [Actinomycetota bacterium]|nr:hypothetical protein [Actinomycetota bacterium]
MTSWRRTCYRTSVAARTFLPVLAARPGGRYLLVVGDTAERPVRGAAPVSVVAAAVLALARAGGWRCRRWR